MSDRGGHWGLLGTGKPLKISLKTEKPTSKTFKTENRRTQMIKRANSQTKSAKLDTAAKDAYFFFFFFEELSYFHLKSLPVVPF